MGLPPELWQHAFAYLAEPDFSRATAASQSMHQLATPQAKRRALANTDLDTILVFLARAVEAGDAVVTRALLLELIGEDPATTGDERLKELLIEDLREEFSFGDDLYTVGLHLSAFMLLFGGDAIPSSIYARLSGLRVHHDINQFLGGVLYAPDRGSIRFLVAKLQDRAANEGNVSLLKLLLYRYGDVAGLGRKDGFNYSVRSTYWQWSQDLRRHDNVRPLTP